MITNNNLSDQSYGFEDFKMFSFIFNIFMTIPSLIYDNTLKQSLHYVLVMLCNQKVTRTQAVILVKQWFQLHEMSVQLGLNMKADVRLVLLYWCKQNLHI